MEQGFVETGSGLRMAVAASAPTAGPTLLFSNSIGTSMDLWRDVVRLMPSDARVICYDARGHGRSDVDPSAFTLEDLADDMRRILDAFDVSEAWICGTSLGGMIAMQMALSHPDRVEGLVLANTALSFPPASLWEDRCKAAAEGGMSPLAGATLERWLTQSFRDANPERAAEVADMFTATPVEGYISCCRVLGSAAIAPDISHLEQPVLVIAGEHDRSSPVARAEEIVSAIDGARLAILDTAHLAAIEKPAEFVQVVKNFMESNGAFDVV
jgi:3-oxoadipate enol-lactonase